MSRSDKSRHGTRCKKTKGQVRASRLQAQRKAQWKLWDKKTERAKERQQVRKEISS